MLNLHLSMGGKQKTHLFCSLENVINYVVRSSSCDCAVPATFPVSVLSAFRTYVQKNIES